MSIPGVIASSNQSGKASMPSGALGIWYPSDYSTSPRPYIPNSLDATSPTSSVVGPGRRNFNKPYLWGNSSLTVTEGYGAGWDGKGESTRIQRAAGGNWYLSPTIVSGGATYIPNGTYTVGLNVKWSGTGSASFQLGHYPSGLVTKTATTSWARYSTQVTISGGTGFIIIISVDGTSACDLEIQDFEVFTGTSDLGPLPIASHIYFQKTAATTPSPTVTAGLVDLSSGANIGFLQLASASSLGPYTLAWTSRITAAGYHPAYSPVLASMQGNGGAGWTTFAVGDDIADSVASQGGSTVVTPAAVLLNGINRNTVTTVVTYDGTTVTLYIGGVMMATASGSSPAQVIKDFYVGRLLEDYYAGMKLGPMGFWARGISLSEATAVTTIFNKKITDAGGAIEPTRVVLFEGDSITFGQGSSGSAKTYPALVAINASPIIRANNFGTSAATLTTLNSRLSTLASYIPANKAGRQFVLHVDIGANDLGVSNAATFISALQTYYTNARAIGFDKIVGSTVISRTSPADGGTQFDIERASANSSILGMVGTYIDACSDFASVALMGANGAANNTTYFADKIHPTDAGYALMSPKAISSLSTVWTY